MACHQLGCYGFINKSCYLESLMVLMFGVTPLHKNTYVRRAERLALRYFCHHVENNTNS